MTVRSGWAGYSGGQGIGGGEGSGGGGDAGGAGGGGAIAGGAGGGDMCAAQRVKPSYVTLWSLDHVKVSPAARTTFCGPLWSEGPE